eukprot:5574216-Pleurochrysis_carterae.AAC.4
MIIITITASASTSHAAFTGRACVARSLAFVLSLFLSKRKRTLAAPLVLPSDLSLRSLALAPFSLHQGDTYVR